MLNTLVQSEIRFSSLEWIGFCDLSIVDASKAAKLQLKSYVWMQEKINIMHLHQTNTNRTGIQIQMSALLKGSF